MDSPSSKSIRRGIAPSARLLWNPGCTIQPASRQQSHDATTPRPRSSLSKRLTWRGHASRFSASRSFTLPLGWRAGDLFSRADSHRVDPDRTPRSGVPDVDGDLRVQHVALRILAHDTDMGRHHQCGPPLSMGHGFRRPPAPRRVLCLPDARPRVLPDAASPGATTSRAPG